MPDQKPHTPPARRSGRPRPPAATALASALALLATVPPPGPAAAQDAPGPGLTVYMQEMALVRTTLDRTVRAGEQTVRVDGLPPNLVALSLLVLDSGVTLRGVHDRRTYRSEDGDGEVSLALDLAVERPLDRLRLAYLTRGAGWSASYSMLVAPDDSSARLDGYATISNQTGTAFDDASVQLMAGTVDTEGGGGRHRAAEPRMAADAVERAPGLDREAFSGYHLYDVDVPLTLAAGAQRRIRLTGADSVSVRRVYVLAGRGDSHRQRVEEPVRQEAVIRYRVERPEGSDFAETPLPHGVVRVYRRDDEGRVQLLGSDAVPNTPANEELAVTVGRAFDVGGTRTQTAWERLSGDDGFETAWEVELFNRTDRHVAVRVVDAVSGDWKIVRSSHEPQRVSAGRVRFDVPVPADGEATLTYRIRVRH